MKIKNLQAFVLAAGKSQRFNTGNTKLIEKICGQEMILYPTRLLTNLNIPTTVTIGYQKERVRAAVVRYHESSVDFIERDYHRGTAHVIVHGWDHITSDHLLIMNGDTPLVTPEIIENLYKTHIEQKADFSFVTAHASDPPSLSYDRVVTKNGITKIVPADEFTGDTEEHCCVDGDIYLISRSLLAKHFAEITKRDNESTLRFRDFVEMASKGGAKIAKVSVPFDDIRGVNTLQELWSVEQVKRAELIRHWMQNGVRFRAAQTVHLDLNVKIGKGSFIGVGVHLLGKTIIGSHSAVHSFSTVENSTLGDHTIVNPHSIITDSTAGDYAAIGPFAHICDKTQLGNHAQVGNFVEVKRSIIGDYSKAKHLSYLGDAHIGNKVTIGAGTITCNYDGVSKHRTTIQDSTLVGSNSALIAPITIHRGSMIAAGSVVTDNVPANSLAIARARQVNKADYAQKIRERIERKHAEKSIKEKRPASAMTELTP